MPTQRTSHHRITHDTFDSLGYDWAELADGPEHPAPPLTVHLPRTVEDVCAVMSQADRLGHKVIVRGNGHSSNKLVTATGSTILLTRYLDRVLDFDADASVVTAQPGIAVAALDDFLAEHGYGLPISPDHADLTLGGFLSVGGISPASHNAGLFIDNVDRIQFVDQQGTARWCSRTEDPDRFDALRAGLGRHGVVTAITCRVVRVDKRGSTLRNDQSLHRTPQDFLRAAVNHLDGSDDSDMLRGVWIDSGKLGGRLRVGQIAAYHEVVPTRWRRARARLGYAYLHRLGRYAARVPQSTRMLLRYLGIAGVVVSPRFASIKNVEMFTDKVLDYNIGDPTRIFVALAPLETFTGLFDALYAACLRQRASGAVSFITIHIKGIRSEYLSCGTPAEMFGELMIIVGTDRTRLQGEVLENFVSEIDDLCISHRAFRYMHTRTDTDPVKRALIDPNAVHCAAQDESAAQVNVAAI